MVTRAEHRRATLLALSDAATALFEEKGDAATIDDIAERAGVARRTIYRWVDQRDDLVFIHPRLWIDEFDAAVAGLDLPPADRIRVGSKAVCAGIDRDPVPVRRAMQVALDIPQLMRGYAAVSQMWIERMAAEVLDDPGNSDRVFRSRVVGAAIMGVIDAALNQWIAEPDSTTLEPLVMAGLDYLEPILH